MSDCINPHSEQKYLNVEVKLFSFDIFWYRFACVKPQFITDKNKTNYIAAHGHDDTWIVAKCKPEVARYLDKKTVSQCWRPLSSSTVRSLVPVSDGSLHYRYIFTYSVHLSHTLSLLLFRLSHSLTHNLSFCLSVSFSLFLSFFLSFFFSSSSSFPYTV